MSEEREEREEVSPELDDVGDDDTIVVDNEEDRAGEPLKTEVGGEVDVSGGRDGMGVGVSKQTSFGPGLTVITGVALPRPLASLRTITTFVPAKIGTVFQVNEVPEIPVKAATMGPSALLV